MKKRYLLYLICYLTIGFLIYAVDAPKMCGLPGCGDGDSTIYIVLLTLIPIFELIFNYKKNENNINILLVVLIILLGCFCFIEKIRFNNNKELLESYKKCSASYNCKCNNNDTCECIYCKDYEIDAEKCNSELEKIECNKKWMRIE